MILQMLTVGLFQSNCYILGCSETREGLVIDPGEEPDRIAAAIERLGLSPRIWLLTHGHIDHVGAAAPLRDRFGGEIRLHPDDLALYEAVAQQADTFGVPRPPTANVDRPLAHDETIRWGQAEGRILHTPGHSPGGVSLHVAGERMQLDGESDVRVPRRSDHPPDWVFTGDVLFSGSIGRTDLPGGSYEVLMGSIRNNLLPLPDETVVASGHGPLTTMGQERRLNPFVRELL